MPSFIEAAKSLIREVVQSKPSINLIVPGAAMPPPKAPSLNPAMVRDTTPVDAVPTTAQPMGRRKPKNPNPLAGKIVFGSDFIPQLSADSPELRAAFDANDAVHMRAFWPHALCDYPVAVNRGSGAPVYGPAVLGKTHTLELVLDCFIDGRRVEAPGQRPTAAWAVRTNQEADFYAGAMTCSNCMCGPLVATPERPWDAIGNRLRRAYKSLTSGDHTVRVDLRYRIVPTGDNIRNAPKGRAVFPEQPTFLSAPIATGSFTVAIPASPDTITLAAVTAPRPDTLPLSPEEAAEYEAATMALLQASSGWGKRAKKTEHVFHVTMTSGWHVTSTKAFKVDGQIVEEPVQRGVSCKAYFYRSSVTGWAAEEIAVFDLTALSAEQRDPKAELPFVHVAVGGSRTFDLGLLPDETLAAIKARCPNAPGQ